MNTVYRAQELRMRWLELSTELAVMRLDIKNGKRELISDYNLLMAQTDEAYRAYQQAELVKNEQRTKEHRDWLNNTTAESKQQMYKNTKIGHL